MYGKHAMLLIALLFFISSGWQPAAAGKEGGWRENTKYLPSYCAYRVTPAGKENRSGRYPALKPVWIHIHHYCKGIYAEYQAKMSLEGREKRKWLADVVNQMHYVGRHCGPQCVLYPELHTRWGWALNQQGLTAQAVEHYRAAIKAKPDYTKAYAYLADLYMGSNRLDEARKILQEGLKVKPKSRLLKRRLQKLE
jgi:tetratricopeptide (TPR) repeat protein